MQPLSFCSVALRNLAARDSPLLVGTQAGDFAAGAHARGEVGRVLIAGKTVATILPFVGLLALLKRPAVVTFLNEASATS